MSPARRPTPLAGAVIAGLAASAVALALAPLLMPPSYSWLSMTTSESAAQGVGGAWLARLGFVLFGLSGWLLVAVRHREWGPAASVLHACFGAFMLATAGFSTRPWQADAAFDTTEDTLHSTAATALGFAFALGVVATAVWAGRTGRQRRWWLDAAAVAASVLVPLAMTALPAVTGVLQRVMFLVAYAWYAAEATGSARTPHSVEGTRAAGMSRTGRPFRLPVRRPPGRREEGPR